MENLVFEEEKRITKEKKTEVRLEDKKELILGMISNVYTTDGLGKLYRTYSGYECFQMDHTIFPNQSMVDAFVAIQQQVLFHL